MKKVLNNFFKLDFSRVSNSIHSMQSLLRFQTLIHEINSMKRRQLDFQTIGLAIKCPPHETAKLKSN